MDVLLSAALGLSACVHTTALRRLLEYTPDSDLPRGWARAAAAGAGPPGILSKVVRDGFKTSWHANWRFFQSIRPGLMSVQRQIKNRSER